MEKIPVNKNEEYIVEIIDNGFEGEGIAKVNGYTIFVKGAIQGEKCKVLILKTTTSHAFAKIVEIIEKSSERADEDCKTYQKCGGCELRHIQYGYTLKLKQKAVQNSVNKTLTKKVTVNETIGMETPYYYRNKAQFPFGYNKQNEPIIGVFAQRTHEIVPMQDCKIQNPVAEKVAAVILEWVIENKVSIYNEQTQKGLLRHLLIKFAVETKQMMIVLVVSREKFEKEQELVQTLLEKVHTEYTIQTIVKNVNAKNTNVILNTKNITLYGDGYIEDKLGEYTFKISPMSFYQTNPIQTEILYNLAIEMAELQKNQILFDLYCGIGTIGIFASNKVKKVYGIEIVEDAIKDAKQNAELNTIKNIEFLCGDVEVTLNELLEKNVLPDVVFVDPPRRGLDETTITNINKIKPKKVIYISCNPATMVRDLKKLEQEYEIQKIQPVDMFPFSHHVECVAALQLK